MDHKNRGQRLILYIALVVILVLLLNIGRAASYPRSVFEALQRVFVFESRDQINSMVVADGVTALRVQLKMLEEENESLRDLLKFFDTVNLRHTEAAVVSRDPINPSVLYISKGRYQGVKVGQPVLAGEGLLIGKIITVENNRSALLLLVSPSSRMTVVTAGDSSASGLLEGLFDESLRMRYISGDEAMAVQDPVITSGMDAGIPRGLLVGTVSSIERSEDSLFASATVQSPVRFDKLHIVSIIDIQ